MAFPPPKRKKQPMERGPLRVFIADDSKIVSDMLTELISDPGRIEVVGTGATEDAAIDSIRSMKPDVVVLDLQLKAGSGTNVIKAVRASGELSATKLMVTSNHTAPQLRTACLGLGADGFYDKVKELGDLAAKLAELAKAKQSS